MLEVLIIGGVVYALSKVFGSDSRDGKQYCYDCRQETYHKFLGQSNLGCDDGSDIRNNYRCSKCGKYSQS